MILLILSKRSMPGFTTGFYSKGFVIHNERCDPADYQKRALKDGVMEPRAKYGSGGVRGA